MENNDKESQCFHAEKLHLTILNCIHKIQFSACSTNLIAFVGSILEKGQKHKFNFSEATLLQLLKAKTAAKKPSEIREMQVATYSTWCGRLFVTDVLQTHEERCQFLRFESFFLFYLPFSGFKGLVLLSHDSARMSLMEV